MSRKRAHLMGVCMTTLGLLALGVATAPAASAANQSDGYYLLLDSATYNSGDDETTYTWSLHHGSRSDDVSHLSIDTCLGGTAVSSNADEYKDAENPDPTTGATGYKWDGEPDVGDTFTIVYSGDTGTGGTSTWAIKKGTGYVAGTTAGPSCGNQDPPDPGHFVVSKAVEGPGPSDDYPFTVTCGPQDSEIGEADQVEGAGVVASSELGFTEDILLGDGESKTYEDLPAGWVCSAEETDDQGATEVVISDTTSPTEDGVVTIVSGMTARADFLNRFPATGSLKVSKTVTGTSSESFPFTVTCTLDSTAVPLSSGDSAFSLAGGGHKTITDLPAGATCTVAETDSKNATSTTVVDSTAPVGDGVVTITAGVESSAAFTNSYVAASTTPSTAEVAGVVFSRSDDLPATGAGETIGMAALAVLLLASGISLVRTSRRTGVEDRGRL